MFLRQLQNDEIPAAQSLIWDVFLEFEAPEYTEEGIREFSYYLQDMHSINKLVFYGAFMGNNLIGIIALLNNNHISLFFVDKNYMGQGIGRQLFNYLLMHSNAESITVNSSPYAIHIYHALGFIDTNIQQTSKGIIFTPMIYHRENRE